MDKLHIELQEGQKIFFTSDLHFGHRNICKPTFANRPWEDEKEMDKELIQNYNNLVSSEDIVFILGDIFWFNDSRTIKKYLNQLNGKEIYIVPGNHDNMLGYHRVEDPRIHILKEEVVVWIKNYYKNSNKILEIYLSHCPMMTWPHRANGVINLFGHIHSGPRVNQDNSDKDIPLWEGQQYDVGVDNNSYAPIELENILKILGKSL